MIIDSRTSIVRGRNQLKLRMRLLWAQNQTKRLSLPLRVGVFWINFHRTHKKNIRLQVHCFWLWLIFINSILDNWENKDNLNLNMHSSRKMKKVFFAFKIYKTWYLIIKGLFLIKTIQIMFLNLINPCLYWLWNYPGLLITRIA